MLGFAAGTAVALLAGVIYSIFALGDNPKWLNWFPMLFTAILFIVQVSALVLLGMRRSSGKTLSTVGTFALHAGFYLFFLTTTVSDEFSHPVGDVFVGGTIVLELLFAAAIVVACSAAVAGWACREHWARTAGVVAAVTLMLTILGASAGALALYVLLAIDGPPPAAASAPMLSPDGAWSWDGTRWLPVAESSPKTDQPTS